MNTITLDCYVNNTLTNIRGGNKIVQHRLTEMMSVYKPGFRYASAYRRGIWDGKIRFYRILKSWKEDGGWLPTGLLPYLQYKIDREMAGNIILNMIDRRARTAALLKSDIENFPFRDYQIEGVESVFNNTFNSIEFPRGIIEVGTGGGKTAMMAYAASRIEGLCLVLTHRQELLFQLAEEIENIIDDAVGIVGAGKHITHRVTVASVPTLVRRLDEYEDFLDNVGAVFIDECHHMQAKTFNKVVSNCNAFFRLGFSGTPMKKDDPVQIQMLRGATGDLLYVFDAADLIERGVVTPVNIHFLEMKDPDQVDGLPSGSLKYRPDSGEEGAYEKLIVKNEYRNKAVVEFVERMQTKQENATLVIVSRIEHGKKLAETLGCPFLSGKEPVEYRREILKQLEAGQERALVATTIFDEGIDAPAINNLVIAAGGKSVGQFKQRIGRGMRKKESTDILTVLDFLDETNPILYRHSKERMTAAEQSGFTINTVRSVNDIFD